MVAVIDAPRESSVPQATASRSPDARVAPEVTPLGPSPSLKTLAALYGNVLTEVTGPKSFQAHEVKSEERKFLAMEALNRLITSQDPDSSSRMDTGKLIAAGIALGASISSAMQKDPEQIKIDKREAERKAKEEELRRVAEREREAKEKAEEYARKQEQAADAVKEKLIEANKLNEHQKKNFILANLNKA